MSAFDPSLPRRTVLQGAGIGLSAGLLSGLATAAQAAAAETPECGIGNIGRKRAT